MHPDDFMAAVKVGAKLVPTDKSYKVYVCRPKQPQMKFYFTHLNVGQREEFVQLYNAQSLIIHGGFYVMPFFMARSQVA
jgi:hypothetical protein